MPDQLPIQISRSTGQAWQSHFGPAGAVPDTGSDPEKLADDIKKIIQTIGLIVDVCANCSDAHN